MDGARVLAKVNGTGYQLQARSGSDKTNLFPELKFKAKTSCILDGEMVCYDENGRLSFNLIQRRINRVNNIRWAVDSFPVVYEVFDVIEAELQGNDVNLRQVSLKGRKQILDNLLSFSDNVRLSPYDGDGTRLFDLAKEKGLEGIVGKHLDSFYLEGKREWLKIKVWQEDTFLVVGYTEGTGWRASTFGALVLSDLKGNYVGAVGTGFNDEEISRLCGMFVPAPCPFPREPETATWIKPFAVKVRYLEKTNDGQLRFPSYKGRGK